MQLLDIHQAAIDEFGRRVHEVSPSQWNSETPCTEWDVRTLVNHLTSEQRWVPPMMEGQTVDQVGDQLEGDLLNGDPIKAWDSAAKAAHQSFTKPGAFDRMVHLSYGDRPAHAYCMEMISDLTIHAWDLARGIGADQRLNPMLVDLVYENVLPYADQMAASGMVAPPVSVPNDVDQQTKLLALFGRDATRQ